MESLFSERLRELEAQASAERSTRPPYLNSLASSSSEEGVTFEPTHHKLDGRLWTKSESTLTQIASTRGHHVYDNTSLWRSLHAIVSKIFTKSGTDKHTKKEAGKENASAEAIESLAEIICSSPTPEELTCVDLETRRIYAEEIVADIMYTESLIESLRLKHRFVRIQARADEEIAKFHARLMHHIMLKKLQEAGGLLAFTRDLVSVIENTMLSYVYFQLADHWPAPTRAMEVELIPILLLATLSKTDTAEQSLRKLEAMCNVVRYSDFALLKPSFTLPREGLEDSIAILDEERSTYAVILRGFALHELSRPETTEWVPPSDTSNVDED